MNMSDELEILNMSIVEEAKELMSDRFPMMVKYFLEDTQMYLEEIEKGVSESNAEIAISPAHTIKSSAKQLGAERVSEIAKAIEELCRDITENGNKDFQQFERLYNDLKSEIDEATPELNKLCV
jgi:HPt (histidine-containing phosphotransfer) domain-containing protein